MIAAVAGGAAHGAKHTFDYYADLADTFEWERPVRPSRGGFGLVVKEPVGVVGAIIPWNAPMGLISMKLAPALIAGCTVVLKTSPEAPGEGYVISRGGRGRRPAGRRAQRALRRPRGLRVARPRSGQAAPARSRSMTRHTPGRSSATPPPRRRDDALAAVAAAEAAWPAWAAMSATERVGIVLKALDGLEADNDERTAILSQENGKIRFEAWINSLVLEPRLNKRRRARPSSPAIASRGPPVNNHGGLSASLAWSPSSCLSTGRSRFSPRPFPMRCWPATPSS